jgi:hypothetical protein
MPLRLALFDASLTADALCAAGVQPEQVGQVVADALAYMASNPTRLTDAQAAHGAARQALDRMERSVRGGAARPDTLAHSQARDAAATARTSLDAARAGLLSAAVASLSDVQRAVLSRIQASHQPDIPVQYRVVERTPAQWTQLKRVLRAKAVTAREGASLSPKAQAILDAADAQAEVAGAAANMARVGPALRSAWAAAITQ